jgi:protein-tyrosine phosphatase
MPSVLFVCLGNICRSPLAEGIFRHHVERRGLADRFVIDSAGTGDWHVGSPPHIESRRVARDRGLDISSQRARQIVPDDLKTFDWVVAMDTTNHRDILALPGAGGCPARVIRLLDIVSHASKDVPDPYFGGADGFDVVYDLLDEACAAFLDHVMD